MINEVSWLQIIIISIISFSGLFIGMLLAGISPEEMKPGKKYFLLFRIVFCFLIAIIGFILFKPSIWMVLIGIVIGLFLKNIYFYLGGILFLSFNLGYSILFSMLVFIYGMLNGTLNSLKYKFNNFKLIIFDALLFFFIGAFSLLYFENLIGVFIGGLIGCAYYLALESYKK